jgi:hypothetical protein
MDSLANDNAAGIFNAPEGPCLSLYQPTHRSHPDKEQDPIRFGNLVKSMEESLRQKYSTRDIRPLVEPFQALAGNHDFWAQTLDGLVALAAPGIFRVYRLQRPVGELAVVADSFHIKPLLRILQSAGRYQVLGLDRQKIRLFEGNRDVLDEVELSSAIPRTITEALGGGLKEPHVTVWTHGSGYPGAGVTSGSDLKSEMMDNDTEKFFRAVDRALLENYSRPSGLPLLLAALPEHRALFHRVSHNPFLMGEGIDISPDALSIEELRVRAWLAVEPHYHARLAGLIEMFEVARSRELGTDDLIQVAANAVAGRVATLLIDADRQIPGSIDGLTGEIQFDDSAKPHVDDLLDDIAELVLRNRGQVVIVPAERMPTQTGLAAIYRF